MTDSLFQFLHLDRFGWRSLIDVLVLSVIIYQVLRIFRGTRAVRMLSGIFVLVAAYILTEPGRLLALPTFNRVLGAFLLFAPLAMVILFQNHIRRVLSLVGSNPLAGFSRGPGAEKMVEEVVLSLVTLASKKHGALIVIEREQGLRTFAETGIEVDAVVSYDLLTTIFMPHTPLHDGAVIIADGRVRAASCFLPLTSGRRPGGEYGSRHRAAIGITEETDAVALVVSEESGMISLMREGRVRSGLEPHELAGAISDLLLPAASRRRRAEMGEPGPASGAEASGERSRDRSEAPPLAAASGAEGRGVRTERAGEASLGAARSGGEGR
jgi:diadenylate cyclase